MGALPLAPGEPYSALQGKRLERLCDGALGTPSQAFVELIHRNISQGPTSDFQCPPFDRSSSRPNFAN